MIRETRKISKTNGLAAQGTLDAQLSFLLASVQGKIAGDIAILKDRAQNLMATYKSVKAQTPENKLLEEIQGDILQLWSDIKAKNPDDFNTYVEIARCHKEFGDEAKYKGYQAQAVLKAKEMADQENPDPKACEFYASYLFGQKQYDEAARYLERAITYSDYELSHSVYYNLALCYNQTKKDEQALFYYRKADQVFRKMHQDKPYLPSLLNQMTIYYAHGDLDRAMDLADIGINTAWDNPQMALQHDIYAQFWALKITILIEDNDLEQAAKICENAIGAYPDKFEFYFKRADLARQSGDLEDAKTLFRNAISINPYYFPAYICLAKILSQQGYHVQAQSWLDQAEAAQKELLKNGKIEEPLFSIVFNQARTAYFLQDYEEAIKYAHAALEMNEAAKSKLLREAGGNIENCKDYNKIIALQDDLQSIVMNAERHLQNRESNRRGDEPPGFSDTYTPA